MYIYSHKLLLYQNRVQWLVGVLSSFPVNSRKERTSSTVLIPQWLLKFGGRWVGGGKSFQPSTRGSYTVFYISPLPPSCLRVYEWKLVKMSTKKNFDLWNSRDKPYEPQLQNRNSPQSKYQTAWGMWREGHIKGSRLDTDVNCFAQSQDRYEWAASS